MFLIVLWVNALGGWASVGCWTFRDALWVVGPPVNALGGWASVGVLDVLDCSVGECL